MDHQGSAYSVTRVFSSAIPHAIQIFDANFIPLFSLTYILKTVPYNSGVLRPSLAEYMVRSLPPKSIRLQQALWQERVDSLLGIGGDTNT